MEEEEQPKDCTFHPQINTESKRILAESMRKQAASEDDFSGFNEGDPLSERPPLFERAALIDKEKRERLNKMRIDSEINNPDLTYIPRISKSTKSILRKSTKLGEDFIRTPIVTRLQKEAV